MDKLTEKGGFKSGQVPVSPGRPRGIPTKKYQVKERLLKRHSIHPVDQLVRIAKFLEANSKFEEAAAIWENLLKYFEPTKKPVETAPEKSTPEESVDSAEETFKLLQEIEQNGLNSIKSSEGNGVASREAALPVKACPEEDLSGHKE